MCLIYIWTVADKTAPLELRPTVKEELIVNLCLNGHLTSVTVNSIMLGVKQRAGLEKSGDAHLVAPIRIPVHIHQFLSVAQLWQVRT